MFKVFVTVYILMSGQPVGDPLKLTNQLKYATAEECAAGKDSAEVQAALDKLRLSLETNKPENGSYTLTSSCEKVDDGSI